LLFNKFSGFNVCLLLCHESVTINYVDINTRVMNYLAIYEFSRFPPSRNILTLEHRLFVLLQLRDKE